jgi:tetratricopeptide (TPR) repeat protein
MDVRVKKFKDLGDKSLEKGDYQEALHYFERLLQIEPKNSVGWSKKAAAEIYLGNLDSALESSNESIRLNKKNADTYFNRGLVYDRRRKFEHALADYNQALKIRPGFVKALNNKGTVLGQLEHWSEAEKCFSEVLKLDPANKDAKENLKLLGDYRLGKHKRKCFIATAAYGTPFASELWYLRTWRDKQLLKTRPGTYFITIYYKLSPYLAEVISHSEILRSIVRKTLKPIISHLITKYDF